MLNSLLIVIEQTCIHLPLVIGAYFSFSLLKAPDLSIEAAYTFGAITSALALQSLSPDFCVLGIAIALIFSILGGCFVGFLSGTFTRKIGIPHLLSSIVTIGLFHGINQYVLGGAIFSLSNLINPIELNLGSETPFLIFSALVLFSLSFLFLKTQLGNMLAVHGNNPSFFANYNISMSFVFIFGICIANALAGISGYLDAQTSGFVEIGMGIGKALSCVTAIILGRVLTMTSRPMNTFIPVVGTFAYFVIQHALINVGFNLKYFTMVQAAIVLIALAFYYRNRGNNIFEKIDNLGV